MTWLKNLPSLACPLCNRVAYRNKRFKCASYFPLGWANGRQSIDTVLKLNHYQKRRLTTCTSLYSKKQEIFLSKRKDDLDMSRYPVEKIRNFGIIAHVDHGKSTLADRMLEIAGTISSEKKNEQVLDKLQVERERGITVKAQTATLLYNYNGVKYLLNLIDTPGHVDFNYEVSRSLAALDGVVLLVDANQGVQAQTVANFFLAFEAGLVIIPVMNKIDLKVAQPEIVAKQIQKLFDVEMDDILKVSAKTGTGVEEVLQAIVEKVPPPTANPDNPLKALLFDSTFDTFRGAVVNVAVKDGYIKKGSKIISHHNKKPLEVQEVGVLYPNEVSTGELYAGQVGYLIANMKSPRDAQIGDTLYWQINPVEPLPGFKKARPMVFAGVFPNDQSEYNSLKSAIDKLTLNDSSVSLHADSSPALGQGWRLGFLGLLHMDVFSQRLEQEYGTSVVMTCPNVPYKVKITGDKNIKKYGDSELTILNPCLLPEESIISEVQEPIVRGTIIAPEKYVGQIMNLCLDRRSDILNQEYIDETRIMFTTHMPLNEIVVDFFDELKSLTSGYASFDYEDNGYQTSNVVKMNILLNSKSVDELTCIVHVSKARTFGRQVCLKLKEQIPRQLFQISIQASVGKKIIAREDVRALRKDVLAKCYGGDISRKMKLLKRQAEGKARMRKIGNIEMPKDAFISVLKRI